MKNRKSRRMGFTLIELVAAVSVMGVLASVAYPTLEKTVHNSENASAIATLEGIGRAAESLKALRADDFKLWDPQDAINAITDVSDFAAYAPGLGAAGAANLTPVDGDRKPAEGEVVYLIEAESLTFSVLSKSGDVCSLELEATQEHEAVCGPYVEAPQVVVVPPVPAARPIANLDGVQMRVGVRTELVLVQNDIGVNPRVTDITIYGMSRPPFIGPIETVQAIGTLERVDGRYYFTANRQGQQSGTYCLSDDNYPDVVLHPGAIGFVPGPANVSCARFNINVF